MRTQRDPGVLAREGSSSRGELVVEVLKIGEKGQILLPFELPLDFDLQLRSP